MKRLGIALALIAGAVVFYVTAYPSLTLRYRLTLEAQVGDEPRIGSGVIEVTYSKVVRVWATTDLSIDVRGEAVVLDLGSRGMLFALLAADTDSRSIPESIILRAYNFDGGAFPGPSVEEGQKQLRRLSGKRELPLDSLPMLVRFRDLNDAMTVERVSPLNIGERFGADAKLVRATLEIVPAGVWPLNAFGITGQPTTTGIERKLPWWNGPFPWEKPMGNGVFIDTRMEAIKANKIEFKRG
ncbi:hypothetical protein [Bradyrhizobium sp. OAE829]|uniref:hypothetical protein n=1 Tax=Bradyrhizobium sp. OAE829 TaxID=2663807 RepID=UPI00178B93DA